MKGANISQTDITFERFSNGFSVPVQGPVVLMMNL